MKLIKKIAAIMFAFMMVFSLSTNVKAESGTSTNTKGSITITNAIKNQDYTIYKILDLESFNADPGKEAYSYKIANGWETFFNSEEVKDYVDVNNGYVTWKDDTNKEAKAAELAKKALAYAKDTTNGVASVTEKPARIDNGNGTETLTYSYLKLGYYLVGSSVGALCGLNTTKPNAEIHEKNGVPSVDKTVYSNIDQDYKDENYADIGEVIMFQTVIHVKKGAKNYVLHDEMSKGLKFKDFLPNTPLNITAKGTIFPDDNHMDLKQNTHYTVRTNEHGFTVNFDSEFLKTYENSEYDIYVHYAATLTKDAEISYSKTLKANRNKTYLTYGDDKTSNEDETQTYTCGIPVYKFTKKFGAEKALAGAQFKLYTNDNKVIELIKVENTTEPTKPTYRKFMTGDDVNKKVDTITTDENGRFNITGLNLGTYFLKETKAPDGYNILTDKITVELTTVGNEHTGPINLKQNNTPADEIGVENNAGSLLPSTGGMGTTLIYLVGGALVLGSGFVLANKKRAKAK